MKTRQGLVSNSSTSSFVMIGFKLDNDRVYARNQLAALLQREIKTDNEEDAASCELMNEDVEVGEHTICTCCHENELGKNKIGLGISLASFDEYTVKCIPLDFDTYRQTLQIVADRLSLTKEESQQYIIAGQEYC